MVLDIDILDPVFAFRIRSQIDTHFIIAFKSDVFIFQTYLVDDFLNLDGFSWSMAEGNVLSFSRQD